VAVRVEDCPRALTELEARVTNEQAYRDCLFPLCAGRKRFAVRAATKKSGRCERDSGNGSVADIANSADGLVSCHVVGDQSEKWSQRSGAEASLGLGNLPDDMGLAAQTTADHD
jgi:hypothetical protein